MSRERDRAVYIISVAAELAGVHPQTLRIYERKGLVDPARTPGGSRRYSDEDIALLRRIQELTSEGLNLAGVQRVLELEAEVRALREQARQLRADMETLLRRARSAPLHDLVSSSTSVVLLRDAHRLPDV
jgi:MerR family transcriptional regulator/heat shock protein HspR